MKIDVHNHAIPEEAVRLLRDDRRYRVTIDGTHVSGGNHVEFDLLPAFHDPDAKLRALAEAGLDAAVISTSPTNFYYELAVEPGVAIAVATNDGLAAMAAARPDRLRWMAHVPLAAPALSVDVLRDAAARGAVGVEIATSIAGRRLDHPDFEPFWAAADATRLPVMLHPAFNEPHRGLDDFYLQNVIGNLLETTVAVERLILCGVLDRYPGVRLVLVHGGGYYPLQAGRLRHAATVRPEMAGAPTDPWAYRDRIFADTLTHDRAVLEFLIRQLAPEQLLVGTDQPFDMASPAPMADLDAVADAATIRQIAEVNPAVLFGFDG